MSYLVLKDLQKRYTDKGPLIVDHMNLSLEKGEFMVFLGPSGCGKTTTIRMISGLEEVTGGDILIDGESILGKKPRDRGVSMIFQSYAIWPHMTVFNNIAYPLKLQKIPKDEIKRRVTVAAQATDIHELLDRYPAQMSGGQRQRVAVSRAIVVEPKIFLMDEPLSNLDAKLRVSMRSELKNIHMKQNSTSIFVTHDQAEAMSLADRIVVMNKGKIEQVGTPMQVYKDSATKFAASFIGTPPTNFFDVIIDHKEGKLTAIAQDFVYPIPAPLIAALEGYKGRSVDLGVRPEFFTIDEALANGGDYLCSADISFVEPQGSYAILITTLCGKEVKIQTTSRMDITPGTVVRLGILNNQVLFFDKDTQMRIQ